MLQALPEVQRKQAVLNFSKSGNNNLTEAFKDNVVLDYSGLRANSLVDSARQRLRDLIHLYVSNMDDGHTRVKMDEVDRTSTTLGSAGSAGRRPIATSLILGAVLWWWAAA